jgi:hypothetical protein
LDIGSEKSLNVWFEVRNWSNMSGIGGRISTQFMAW